MYPLDSFSIQANGSSSDQSVSIINTGIPGIAQVGQFINLQCDVLVLYVALVLEQNIASYSAPVYLM